MIRKFLIAGVAFAAIAAPALAQEVEFSGNVALTSDYTWRGVSQSNGDLAIQGGFDVAAGSFYAGTWASSIDFGDATDSNVELDFYAGFAGETESGIGWDVGLIYYAYPDTSDTDIDFAEVYGGLSYSFEGGIGVGGYLYYDPDNETVYADFSADYGITDAFSVGATYGVYLDGYGEYSNWSIGGSYATSVGIDLGLAYVENDQSGSDEAVVFSISKAL